MEITIIGSNTINGIKLRKNIIKIANKIEEKITINLIDEKDKEKLPILYINNELISSGKIPSKKEIVKLLKRNYKDTKTMI